MGQEIISSNKHEILARTLLGPIELETKDGHQPNSRALYTHYKDPLLKVG